MALLPLRAPAEPLPAALPYAADLANFIVPTPLPAVHHHVLVKVNPSFTAGYVESTRTRLRLLVVTAWFLVEHHREAGARILGVMAALIGIASLGPVLRIAGRRLPAVGFAFDAPVVRYILPGRFTVHLFLVLALIVSFWLSRPDRRPVTR